MSVCFFILAETFSLIFYFSPFKETPPSSVSHAYTLPSQTAEIY